MKTTRRRTGSSRPSTGVATTYSVIASRNAVHAVESFLKTGSIAANWWHNYRTTAEFLKPWEELVVKLQAKPSQEEAKQLEREAAQEMRALFIAKATVEFVTSRQDLQPSTLQEVTMTDTPKQFQQDLEASIRCACPSMSAFEFADHVLKGMEPMKELHRLMQQELDRMHAELHVANKALEGKSAPEAAATALETMERERVATETKHKALFGGKVEAALTLRQCQYVCITRRILTSGKSCAQKLYEALLSKYGSAAVETTKTEGILKTSLNSVSKS
ncbi:hypothetical protein RI054_34g131630 [Pseudoscourfieldia marina]